MINLTEQAASMIRHLLDDADLADGAGLRIAQRDDHTALAMGLCDQPHAQDVVVVEHQATVFVGPIAARRIQGQTLDATLTESRSSFYLRD
ncbi:MAG: hypothetical protein NVSMB55_23860 [Mycobacteriales bacterium]